MCETVSLYRFTINVNSYDCFKYWDCCKSAKWYMNRKGDGTFHDFHVNTRHLLNLLKSYLYFKKKYILKIIIVYIQWLKYYVIKVVDAERLQDTVFLPLDQTDLSWPSQKRLPHDDVPWVASQSPARYPFMECLNSSWHICTSVLLKQ